MKLNENMAKPKCMIENRNHYLFRNVMSFVVGPSESIAHRHQSAGEPALQIVGPNRYQKNKRPWQIMCAMGV